MGPSFLFWWLESEFCPAQSEVADAKRPGTTRRGPRGRDSSCDTFGHERESRVTTKSINCGTRLCSVRIAGQMVDKMKEPTGHRGDRVHRARSVPFRRVSTGVLDI
jgi:hypothetical protein